MNKAVKLLFVLSLVLLLGAGTCYSAESYKFATTDMTWAEFYAGEVEKSSADLYADGLDAVSSPTARIANSFSQLTSESNDIGGRSITGVKAVQVRMSQEVYNLLSKDKRYTFSDDVFAEYKPVNADGSFGKMVTESHVQKDASVSLAAPGTWGDYVLAISSIDIKVGTGGRDASYYLGALVETSDGKVYGMRHNNNLWFGAGELAVSTAEFIEPHGVSRSYKYTSDMGGKTIKKITYMLKNLPDEVVNCDVFLKNKTSASVKVSSNAAVKSGSNVSVALTSADVPNDAGYKISFVTYTPEGANRRNRQPLSASDYSYSNGRLTLTEAKAGTYTVTFASSKYVDISASFTVTDYYAKTYMTWAEFYAGETGQTSADLLSEGLDAVSTPTKNAKSRFPLISYDIVSTDTTYANKFTGYVSIDVRMTQNVYDTVKNNPRYTFTATAPSEYKVVNSDGSFGAMVTATTNASKSGAKVSMATGASARWGHYVLSVSSADINIGTSGDKIARNYLGALIETKDGKIYGMRHDNNLWSNTDIAFTVNENFTEPHKQGATRYWQYTSDLEGKTITKITYLLKGLPDVVIDSLDILVKPLSSATVQTAKTSYNLGSGAVINFTFGNLPSGVSYDLISLYRTEGRTRIPVTNFTYKNGVLTVNEDLANGSYTAVFGNDGYADIANTFEVKTYYATTDMTWAEFYAGEAGETSADLYADGLDAVSSPTARIANSFSQLTSESNDIKGRSITGVKAVQVRMTEEVYNLLSNDKRYTWADDAFAEYKPVNADGSFGKMVTESHVQEGASVSLTAPGTWGDYVLAVSSIDITLGSGDTRYYLGALVETSDGKIYGMRHNNNLWFQAKDLAISTAEFVEVHGVSRRYEYTSDMEGKTIKKITYMLKNLPDEIVSCDVFLKLRTSASVSPVYETGYHAVMASQNTKVQLKFANLPESSDYQLAGVTFGTGQGRKAVDGCTFKDGILTISGDAQEGTYSARFTDEKYMDISAVIKVYTTLVTDKIVSSANNPAGLTFLLTPKGVCDSTDAVLDAQNFVNATEYTVSADNSTAVFADGLGFSLDVKLKDVPEGKMAILGFSKNLEITPAKIGSAEFSSMSQKVLALPDVAYGWRVPTAEQLKDIGLTVTAVYPDGVSRDVTGYISSGLFPTDESITFSFGTVLIDRAFTPSEEGKVYLLSEEGEGTMSDGAHDGNITATWFVSFTGSQKGNQDTPSNSNTTNNTGNNSNTSDNTAIARNTVTPSAPSMPMTEAVQSVIKEALGKLSGKISADTPVAVLPETAVKGYQSVASVDSSAVYLPVIVVTEAKIYVFGVSLDKFAAGSPIYWNSNATDVNTGEFVSAADDEEAVTFFDDNGDETSIVPYPPLKKHVNVAAYLEPEREYSPTITTSKNTSTEEGVGSSSGGCDTGFAVPLMLLGLLYAFRSGRRF